jgi:hypothetical protein
MPDPMQQLLCARPYEAANVFPMWRAWNRKPSGSPASATHSGQPLIDGSCFAALRCILHCSLSCDN